MNALNAVPVRRFARLVRLRLHDINPLTRGGLYLKNTIFTLGVVCVWKKWLLLNQTHGNETEIQDLYGAIQKNNLPQHVGIIMDGNGRWAQKRGLPRVMGHRAGVGSLRKIVQAAYEIGLNVITVYAFSTENWKRPSDEVDFLMELFSSYLEKNIDELEHNGVQLRFIGDIQGLSPALKNQFVSAQQRTANNQGLILNAAVNYGGRAEIVHAVRLILNKIAAGQLQAAALDESMIQQHLYTGDLPNPDLIIRPSGDKRLSNFLLWQSAYAEFWFTDICWPDFKPEHLVEALLDYQRRERRFGGLKT